MVTGGTSDARGSSKEKCKASRPFTCSTVTRCSTSPRRVAGPTATLMLAEVGAEVIKVELTPNGDLTPFLSACCDY